MEYGKICQTAYSEETIYMSGQRSEIYVSSPLSYRGHLLRKTGHFALSRWSGKQPLEPQK